VTLQGLFDNVRQFATDAGIANLRPDDRFAAWWVAATLAEAEDVVAARQSLTDANHDGGIDAVFIDTNEQSVFLIQTKARNTATVREERQTILELTRWASLLAGPLASYQQACADLYDRTRELLDKARAAVEEGYSLELQFVTTGTANGNMLGTQRNLVAATQGDGEQEFRFLFFDNRKVLQVYEDWLHGARLIPKLTLKATENYLRDRSGNHDLAILLVPGDDIADAVKRYRDQLFARNIRGFVGARNQVNQEIWTTIERAPGDFKFLNNGLVIVCDRMEIVDDGDDYLCTFYSPSVVNGQQTATTLQLARDTYQPHPETGDQMMLSLRGVLAPVRAIVVDRDENDQGKYQDFISRVVKATNFQTKVTIPDLYANDWRQVEVGRKLRRAGYYYARKSETSRESTRQAAGRPIIKRKDLADAVGGCIEESLPHRVTKEMLYQEASDGQAGNYERIFDMERKADYFVSRYFLWAAVKEQLPRKKGTKITPREQEQGKWLVLFELNRRIGRDLDKSPRSFIDNATAHGGVPAVEKAQKAAIKALAKAAGDFYAARAGRGNYKDDVAGFFKTKNLQPAFTKFISSDATHKRAVEKAITTLRKALV
jgi:hypothetical protein